MNFKLLFACALLGGCATVTNGTKITDADWNSLIIGETTKIHILQKFGKPLVSGSNEFSMGTGAWKLCGEMGEKLHTVIYTYRDSSAKVFPGVSRASSSSQTYTLRFNKEGILCMKDITSV